MYTYNGLLLERKAYAFTILVVEFAKRVSNDDAINVRIHQILKVSADLSTLCFELAGTKDPKIKEEKLKYCGELARLALELLQKFECHTAVESQKADITIEAAELTTAFEALGKE